MFIAVQSRLEVTSIIVLNVRKENVCHRFVIKGEKLDSLSGAGLRGKVLKIQTRQRFRGSALVGLAKGILMKMRFCWPDHEETSSLGRV
jgi:hypothetical protein